MTSAAEAELLVDVVDGVATLTLNRPARLNAIDHGQDSLHRELVETLERLDDDPEVRVFVITGAGRAFSAGGDLGKAPKSDSRIEWLRFLTVEDEDNERIRRLRKPTIGAINGICYGAALIMAAHFDMLVATEGARLGFIETRFGGTGVDVIAYHVGPQWAKFLALSGELITARRAEQIGLVLAAVPDAEFSGKVADLAKRVASIPPAGAQINRMVVNGVLDNMGWGSQKHLAMALDTIANGESPRAAAADGRLFSELQREGWDAYKAARDAPFKEPWLQ